MTMDEVIDPILVRQQELERACGIATGTTNTILSKALSHFPKLAEEFIKTQNYAASVMGYPNVWFNVTHKKPAKSSLTLEVYKVNETENLDKFGYSGETLVKFIATVRAIQSGHFEHIKDIGHIFSVPLAYAFIGYSMPAALTDEGKSAVKILELLEFTEENLEEFKRVMITE